MKNIVILGSTGSIGTQAIDVIENSKDFKIVGLAAKSNVELLAKQALKFNPEAVCIVDEDKKDSKPKKQDKKENLKMIEEIEEAMKQAAKELDFERAMELRDALFELKAESGGFNDK